MPEPHKTRFAEGPPVIIRRVVSKRRKAANAVRWLVVLFLSYYGLAYYTHAIRHPDVGELDRLMDFVGVMSWEK